MISRKIIQTGEPILVLKQVSIEVFRAVMEDVGEGESPMRLLEGRRTYSISLTRGTSCDEYTTSKDSRSVRNEGDLSTRVIRCD